MFKRLILLFGLLAFAISTQPKDLDKIAQGLQNSFKQEDRVNILVTFRRGTDEVLKIISDIPFPTRDALLDALANALQGNSRVSQEAVEAYLQQGSWTHDSLWVTDQMWVKDATIELVFALAGFPEVRSIMEDELTLFSDPTPTSPIVRGKRQSNQWNIQKIQAEEAGDFLRNITTNITTVRVATIDTGVRGTHESLVDNFLGSYGWFDPGEGTEFPNDQNGHGTHTMGTICGTTNGIGVYPEAKWLSCKGCAGNFCSMYDLIKCGQFLMCPTHPNGTNHDCTKAPHLISNSWAVQPDAFDWYDGVIAAWRVGHIIPIFGNGNAGPQCGTVGYPAGHAAVIGVGSTTVDDAISSFSSLGPTTDRRLKPDVVAPGSNIVSAIQTGDSDYRALSGTSMACPHAAGVVAILLAYNPDLTYTQVSQSLFNGTERALLTGGRTCDGIDESTFPNHVFGQGRVNALSSLMGLVAKQKH